MKQRGNYYFYIFHSQDTVLQVSLHVTTWWSLVVTSVSEHARKNIHHLYIQVYIIVNILKIHEYEYIKN